MDNGNLKILNKLRETKAIELSNTLFSSIKTNVANETKDTYNINLK